MRVWLPVLWAVASLPHLAALPLPRPYAVDHYDVSIAPDLAAQVVTGQETLRYHTSMDQMDAMELDAGALEVISVVENGAAQWFERKGALLMVVLAEPAHAGEQRTLTIRYRAKAGKGLVFFPDQVYTSFFTSDWMVTNDQPDDRATLHLSIAGTTEMQVAASGRAMMFHATGAQGLWEWRLDTPSPGFLFAFAAGKFTESTAAGGDVKLRILGKAKVFEPTVAALRFLAEKSGKPYPGDSYTQVFTRGDVMQEAAGGLTLLPESYAEGLEKKPDDLWLLVHEAAHQWYGIGIPCRDWSDFWLSEGMATFLADAFLEQKYGKKRYEEEIAHSLAIYDELRKAGKDRPLSFHDWNTPQQAGGRLPYHKGVCFLALLRKHMGEAAFWSGIQAYTSANWGKPVTSEDFQRAMEAAAKHSLAVLFDRWVYGT
jgi:aminopeptidase N